MSMRHYLDHFPETVIVRERVSAALELTPHLLRHQALPVIFEDLDGHRAVGNLWSTRERIARALGTDPATLMGRMLYALDHPESCIEVDHPPFLRNVREDFSLNELPIPQFYQGDGGRYITAGVVVAELEGKRNMSFHRLMQIGERELAIRLVPRDLYRMHHAAIERGEELKVGVAIGLCPSVLLPAAMSVEYEKDELEIASGLRRSCLGEPVGIAKLRSRVHVPAWAELAMEGRITARTATEGPFVDITGTYDVAREQPILEVDRLYHVPDPVFHILLPGGLEHYLLMGMPREPLIMRSVARVARVKGVRLTEGGCCWLHGIVAIQKTDEGDGKRAALAAFEGHKSMKHVVIVDDDIDPGNPREVEWAVATRFQGHRGLIVLENQRGSTLDPSADKNSITTKIGLDATKPLGAKGFEKAQ